MQERSYGLYHPLQSSAHTAFHIGDKCKVFCDAMAKYPLSPLFVSAKGQKLAGEKDKSYNGLSFATRGHWGKTSVSPHWHHLLVNKIPVYWFFYKERWFNSQVHPHFTITDKTQGEKNWLRECTYHRRRGDGQRNLQVARGDGDGLYVLSAP